MRTLLLALALTAGLVGAPSASASTVGWAAPGPFPVTVESLGPAHTVYRPATLGANGQRHPVIVWGNGTFAVPAVYESLLRHLASHGFVVAAANTINAGTGREMLAGAEILLRENEIPTSVYHHTIDPNHIGATGHSQGGGGAIAAGADPRITTTVPIEPGPQGRETALSGPMFILGGERDTIAIPPLIIIPRYQRATQIPAVYGELGGASHFTPIGDGGGFRGAITAWFRFWLMNDERARTEFFGPDCGLCTDAAWSDLRRNTRALAIPGSVS